MHGKRPGTGHQARLRTVTEPWGSSKATECDKARPDPILSVCFALPALDVIFEIWSSVYDFWI